LRICIHLSIKIVGVALLLLVLPLSGECQSDAVQTQEPSEPIEEIVVRGHKSLIDLTHEMYERMLAEMTELASERPDYLNALIKFTEATQTLESEHKRRCEGRLLICRRQ